MHINVIGGYGHQVATCSQVVRGIHFLYYTCNFSVG